MDPFLTTLTCVIYINIYNLIGLYDWKRFYHTVKILSGNVAFHRTGKHAACDGYCKALDLRSTLSAAYLVYAFLGAKRDSCFLTGLPRMRFVKSAEMV